MTQDTIKQDWSAYAVGRNLSRNRLTLSWHAEMIDDYLRVFTKVAPGSRVLDIGPASGLFMVLLRELGLDEADGLEISEVYREVLKRKGLNVFAGDIVSGEGLDQLRAPYDAVQMMEVLEHLPDPRQALIHVRELLKENGLFYATVPISDSIFDRLHRWRRKKTRHQQVMEIDPTHVQAFSAKTLRALFEGCGFKVEEIRRLSFKTPGPIHERYVAGYRPHLLLRALLPSWWRGTNLSVVARPA